MCDVDKETCFYIYMHVFKVCEIWIRTHSYNFMHYLMQDKYAWFLNAFINELEIWKTRHAFIIMFICIMHWNKKNQDFTCIFYY